MSFIKKAWQAVKAFGRNAWGYIKGMNGKRAGSLLGSAIGTALSGVPVLGSMMGAAAIPALTMAGAKLGDYLQGPVDHAVQEFLYDQAAADLDEKFGLKKRAKERRDKWNKFKKAPSEPNPLPQYPVDDSDISYNK